VTPRAELIHWAFAAGFLLLGLFLLAESIVGTEVYRRRAWRAYLWPGLAFGLGLLLWPVVVFFTSSTIHMLAHSMWAEAAMLAAAVQLAVVRGRLTSQWWSLAVVVAMLASGLAFLVHEQNPWLFDRAAFLHHTLGWVLVLAAVFPLGQAIRPGKVLWQAGFAATWITVAVLLFCDRDLAPIFGHLSDVAGGTAP
jgi:hypothetical protein